MQIDGTTPKEKLLRLDKANGANIAAKIRQISVKANNTGICNDFKIVLGIYLNQNGVG